MRFANGQYDALEETFRIGCFSPSPRPRGAVFVVELPQGEGGHQGPEFES